ncbi:MAG: hypothetical protein ACI4OT_03415 [Bacilli bacterium]
MKYDIPLDLISYLAIELKLETENKRDLTLKELLEYRELLIKKINEKYQKNSKWYDYDKKIVLNNNKIEFKSLVLNDIKNLYFNNKDIFYFNKNTITLREDITAHDLENIINYYNIDNYVIEALLLDSHYCNEALDILNIKDFKKIIEEFINHEKNIQQMYEKLETKEHNKEIINHINLMQYLSNVKYHSLLKKDFRYFRRFVNQIHENNRDVPLVIDSEILKNTNICDEIIDFQNTCLTYDPILRAIFTDESIAVLKISRILDDLSINEELSYEEIYDYDEDDEELYDYGEDDEKLYDYYNEFSEENYDIDFQNDEYDEMESQAEESERNYRNQMTSFAFNYINNIKEYNSSHKINKNLEKIKNKLIYFYDNLNINLYDDETFNYCYNYYKNVGNYEYIYDYNTFAKGLIVDIFENKNLNKQTEKLIFIKTCLNIFKDDDLIDIFNSYSEHDKYQEYKKVIFGKSKQKIKEI